MDIFQIAEFQSEFWDFTLPQGLEEMLEIKKRLFGRSAGENTILTCISCGCGNNCKGIRTDE